MAIKGKGKTKPRPATRAPKRAAVEVKPPFFLRRQVQVIGAFVVGIGAMVFLVWLTNGLREQKAKDEAAAKEVSTRAVVQAWQTTVEGKIGALGTISPGVPPTILPDESAVIDALAKGGDPPVGAAGTLKGAIDSSGSAVSALDGYSLTKKIRDQGFVVEQTNYLLNSQKRMVQGLELYAQAARLARQALDAGGAARKELGGLAADTRDTATGIFNDGWTDLENVKASVGIFPTPGLTPP